MYYLIMIFLLIVLLFVCYSVFNRDLLYPPVIAVAMFLFSSVVGLLRYDAWNIADYSGFTVLLIMTGLLSFIFSSFLVYQIFPHNYTKNITPFHRERIELNGLFLCIVIAVLLVHDYLYYSFILKNVESMRVFGLSVGLMINYFRNMGYTETVRLAEPIYLQILSVLSYIAGIFSLFIFAHNSIFNRLKKQEFLLAIIIILNLCYNLLNSNRGALLRLLAELICCYYVFWSMKSGWVQVINKKFIKLSLRVLVFFIPCFIALAFFTGRYGDIEKFDISRFEALNYLSIYSSSGVRNFDLYVKQPVIDDKIIGKESFYGINRFLYNRFDIGVFYDPNLEFRSIKGKNTGNIYTAFRRYYADFGIIGLILLPFIMGVFFSYIYCKAKCDVRKNKVTFFLLMFVSLSYCIFYFPIDDTFYHFNLRVGIIPIYVLLYCLYWFVRDDSRLVLKFRSHSGHKNTLKRQ